MDKISMTIKENRITVLIFWLALVYIVSIFFIKGVLKSQLTLLKFVFMFAIGCFTYIDISLSIEYASLRRMIGLIKELEKKYNYMQIYYEKNIVIVEIEKDETEKFQKDMRDLKLRTNELYNEDKLIQFVVRS